MHKIGIRYEDKYVMERRVPLVPIHVKQLVEKGLEIEVVHSAKRIFKDAEFENAGAKIVDAITDSDIILGVKEMPIDFFKNNKTYIFFSHTIKGQPYNMPLLQRMIEKKVNLIDYERIADEEGRRLIFFGRFAGLAGMINSLWSLGQRYKVLGIDTPFLKIQQTHRYDSLDEAKKVIAEVGEEIRQDGLPKEITPLNIAITGYGNVSGGAQEIIDLLPNVEISPEELLKLEESGNVSGKHVYKTVFKEEHLSKPKEQNKKFELQEYYDHPERFEDQFEQYIPHISCLMNCMYWDERYPRIVTKDYLEKLFRGGQPKMTVIGDVTCDPDGSIECTHKGTEIEDPVFVYNPFTRKPTMGFTGEGVLVMAVDILPSELPREASQTFSDALVDFIPEIAKADFNENFEALKVPGPIKRALILHNGALTPDYEYLNDFLT
jgi:saccharopine dehydrogenase (NAD+, L-lysine forming)